MASSARAQRRSTDSGERPSHPADSCATSPWAIASRTWATSTGSPATTPASIARRTASTTVSRAVTPARTPSGPGPTAANGFENITSANVGLSRTNRR